MSHKRDMKAVRTVRFIRLARLRQAKKDRREAVRFALTMMLSAKGTIS